jgi:hypothetical protein
VSQKSANSWIDPRFGSFELFIGYSIFDLAVSLCVVVSRAVTGYPLPSGNRIMTQNK